MTGTLKNNPSWMVCRDPERYVLCVTNTYVLFQSSALSCMCGGVHLSVWFLC